MAIGRTGKKPGVSDPKRPYVDIGSEMPQEKGRIVEIGEDEKKNKKESVWRTLLEIQKKAPHQEKIQKTDVEKISLAGKKPRVQKIQKPKDEITKKIEGIMEEGLEEIYAQMPPAKQVEFKFKGEESSEKIRATLRKTKISVKKILKIILEWLKIIPGVNRFFLEQEAKIKAEKILSLKSEFKKP